MGYGTIKSLELRTVLRMYQVVLFFHLLGALLFFAGIVVAGMAFELAGRRQRAGEVVALLSLARVGVLLVAIGGVMLPIFGPPLAPAALRGSPVTGWRTAINSRSICGATAISG